MSSLLPLLYISAAAGKRIELLAHSASAHIFFAAHSPIFYRQSIYESLDEEEYHPVIYLTEELIPPPHPNGEFSLVLIKKKKL